MHITTYTTAERAAQAAARLVIDRLSAQPDLVLGLPTGNTPVPLYKALVRAH
ncbi:MAG: glucosamine-6-phosphate deaminase, partial [Acidobacteria bacterium]|nr:glucosamine-6-phosphate deaminase [Acidobacteriota bacterium]